MSLKLLEDNWDAIIKKVIEPLWKYKFQTMYESAKLDKDDFFSIAGEELTKAFKYKYDPKVSNIYTFARCVVQKKAETELRDCTKRDKRFALYEAESLDIPIDEEHDELKHERIAVPQIQDNSNKENIRKYLTKLSATEKDVIIFKLIGFDEDDVVETLGISQKKYNDSVKSMQIYEKASILRRKG